MFVHLSIQATIFSNTYISCGAWNLPNAPALLLCTHESLLFRRTPLLLCFLKQLLQAGYSGSVVDVEYARSSQGSNHQLHSCMHPLSHGSTANDRRSARPALTQSLYQLKSFDDTSSNCVTQSCFTLRQCEKPLCRRLNQWKELCDATVCLSPILCRTRDPLCLTWWV